LGIECTVGNADSERISRRDLGDGANDRASSAMAHDGVSPPKGAQRADRSQSPSEPAQPLAVQLQIVMYRCFRCTQQLVHALTILDQRDAWREMFERARQLGHSPVALLDRTI
jgi:hypothetical protein